MYRGWLQRVHDGASGAVWAASGRYAQCEQVVALVSEVENLTAISNFWALTARSLIGKSWKIVDIARLWPGLSRRRLNHQPNDCSRARSNLQEPRARCAPARDASQMRYRVQRAVGNESLSWPGSTTSFARTSRGPTAACEPLDISDSSHFRSGVKRAPVMELRQTIQRVRSGTNGNVVCAELEYGFSACLEAAKIATCAQDRDHPMTSKSHDPTFLGPNPAPPKKAAVQSQFDCVGKNGHVDSANQIE
jgi:hypothetical protein